MSSLDIGTVSGALEMRDTATAVLKRFAVELVELERKLASAEAASKRVNLGAALQGLSNKAMLVGAGLTAGITLPLLGVAKATGEVANEFEKEMVRIVTLVGVAEGQVQQWRGTLLDMAGEVGVGPNELAKALFVVTSAGIRSATAIDVLRESAKASALGLGETAVIARTVTAAMQAWGEQGLSASRATDILTATVREGNLAADELAGTLGRVMGVAATVGVSFEQVGGFVATFTRLGVNSAEAVTALRGVLNTFLKTGNEARQTLEAYGLSAQKLRDVIKNEGLAAALGLLVDTFKGNEDALAKVIPNVRALGGVLGTAGVQGKQYQQILRSLEESHRMTADGFKRTTETMAFGWAQLKAESEALAIKMGDRLAPAMRKVQDNSKPLVEALITLVDKFAALPEGVQQTILGVSLLAGPISLVSGLVVKLGGWLTSLWGILSGGLRWLLTGGKGLIEFGAGFEMAGASIGAWLLRMAGAIGLLVSLTKVAWDAGQSNSELTRQLALGMGPVGTLSLMWRALKTEVMDASTAMTEAGKRLEDFRKRQAESVAGRAIKAPTFEQGQANLQEMLTEQLRGPTGGQDWSAKLAAAQKELAKVESVNGPAMRSFWAVSASVEGLSKQFGLSELAAQLFSKKMGEAKKEATKAAKELKHSADEVKKAFEQMTGGDAVDKAELAMTVLSSGAMPQGAQVGETLKTLEDGMNALRASQQPVSDEMLAWIDYLRTQVGLALEFQAKVDSWANAIEEVRTTAGNPAEGLIPPVADPNVAKLYFDPMGLVPGFSMAGIEAAKTFADGWKEFDWDVIGDTILRAMEGGGNVGAALATALGNQLMKAMKDTTSVGGKIAGGIGAGLVAGIQANSVTVARESKAMGALAGAASGAAMGAAFGPIGMGVGAAIGAIGGLLGDAGKKARELREELLKNAGGVAELEKAAKWAGVSMDAFLNAKKAKDVQAAFDKIQAAIKATQERLQKLSDDLGALGDSGLLNLDLLVRLNADKGKDEIQKVVADFMKSNTQKAVAGLGAFLTLPDTLTKGLTEARDKVKDLTATEADLVAKMTDLEGKDHLTAQQARDLDETRDKLAEVRAEMAKAQSSVDKFGSALSRLTLSPTTASALQAGLGGLFGDLLAQGSSPVDAITQLAPAIKSLNDQMAGMGLTATPAFAEISRLASLATDEVSGPLLQAISGLGQGLIGLHNTGLLTSDMFTGLARGAYDAFHTLELQGQGGTDAVRMMQPTLQRIWELQQDFGYSVDESTQKLLDFATESGLVGDKFRPAQDQMLKALDALVGRFDKLIGLFQQLLPGAAQSGADQINAALSTVNFDGIRQKGVDAFRDIEEAATGAAWGHSPTGIKEIPLALDQAIAKLSEFGPYAKRVFATVEDMAGAYGHMMVASADDLGKTIQSLSYQLIDLTSTPLQKALNGIERELMSTIDGMGQFVNDPRYKQATELARQVAELKGREAQAAERERLASEAKKSADGADKTPQLEQIIVVHLDGKVVTEAAIKGLPEKVRVLTR